MMEYAFERCLNLGNERLVRKSLSGRYFTINVVIHESWDDYV